MPQELQSILSETGQLVQQRCDCRARLAVWENPSRDGYEGLSQLIHEDIFIYQGS